MARDRDVVIAKIQLINRFCGTGGWGKRQNGVFSLISLIEVDPEGSFKHCIAVGISRRLAGYWEKFSISNHHVSVEPH